MWLIDKMHSFNFDLKLEDKIFSQWIIFCLQISYGRTNPYFCTKI